MPATEASIRLRDLARRMSGRYAARAALLVGSAALGEADGYSDLDLLVYYDVVPGAEALGEAASALGAQRYGSRTDEEDSSVGERYLLDGIECQVAHVSVGSVEHLIEKVTVDHQLDEELLKVLSGLCDGLPIAGSDLVEEWRAQATITEPLQRAMLAKRWRFFPWWYFQARLGARDTTIWRYDVLVQSAYALVGSLAALNGLYFSTLEFKRAGRFFDRFTVAPDNFGPRLERLFRAHAAASAAELERLVAETRELVASRFPDFDLAIEWGGHPADPGARERRWP